MRAREDAYLSPLAINFTEEKSQITQISVTFSYTPPETHGTGQISEQFPVI